MIFTDETGVGIVADREYGAESEIVVGGYSAAWPALPSSGSD
jgi:hypothetical protein